MNDAYAQPSADEVAVLVKQFVDLEERDPKAFAEQVADNIMEPVKAETMALRSPELVNKTLVAVRFLTDQTVNATKKPRRGSDEERRRNYFLAAVARERRTLEVVIAGLRAQGANLAPVENPRKRALARLANENLRGDVPKGRFRDLLEEEEEITRERRRQAKREARDARRATKPPAKQAPRR